LGSFGDASVFSIHKSLPVPAGGALVFKNGNTPDFARRRTPPLRTTASFTLSAMKRNFDVRGLNLANVMVKAIRACIQKIKKVVGPYHLFFTLVKGPFTYIYLKGLKPPDFITNFI